MASKSLLGSGAMVMALVLAPAFAAESSGSPSCGDGVVVQQGDTLSGIASRCDVAEAMLLRANPTIQGSGDLQVGGTLHVDGGGGAEKKVGAAGGTFSRRASNAIGQLAGDVGSSVHDLLEKNPNLKARLDMLSSRAGPNGEEETPTATVMPQDGLSGSTVTITARGLPANRPVAIGAGAPGTAYAVIAHAQSTASGTIETTLMVPKASQRGQVIVFSLAAGAGVAARTGRFVVGP